MKVTATLTDWSIVENAHGGYAWGRIHEDIRERWQDGTRMHTSQIMAVEYCPDEIIIKTMNSVYRLPHDRVSGVFGSAGIHHFTKLLERHWPMGSQ